MSAKVIWLCVFVFLYWSYCIAMGLKGMRMVKTASDYFIAGRRLGLWVFVLAATATSFSGWTFMGHPGLVYRDGFQYAYASFYTITIPLTGVIFLKRQWMLGKRFGYVTPGEMLSDYFQGDVIRLLTVLVALLFSIPYLGVQLGASGYLFNVLTDGLVDRNLGMWVLSAVVLAYVASGGLRAVAYVDTMQCILLAVGIVITGVIALDAVGGWQALNGGLAQLGAARTDEGLWVDLRCPTAEACGTHSSYFAIPGVIQFTAGLGKETPAGGLWTGVMCLTYMWALMGIQSAPAFTMWAFGNTNPKPFALQQVWASSFGVGLILFFFTAMQGVGAHLLGGNPLVNQDEALWQSLQDRGAAVQIAAPPNWSAAVADDGGLRRDLEIRRVIVLVGNGTLSEQRAAGSAAVAAALAGGDVTALEGAIVYRLTIPETVAEDPDSLVPYYFNLIGDGMPWLVGILAVCALAAMQSTGAAYMSTAGSMLTRDLYKRFLNPTASHDTQKRFGRMGVAFIVLSALLVATFSTDALVLLGGLAVAFGFQMWTSLAAICYFPWITRQGATWGMLLGILGVTFTDSFGIEVLEAMGMDLWGRWPLTIHSAGWGMLFNLVATVAISAVTQNERATAHRMTFHTFLRDHASLPEHKRALVPWGWAAVILWTIFAIGPGAVIGNTVFGAPDDAQSWVFGIPSIWAWQILFWVLGVAMMWFLAVKLELSTVPQRQVEALLDDIGDAPLPRRSGAGAE